MNEEKRWHERIAQYQTGEISDDEFAELERILEESEEARKLFHQACRIDTHLRREASNPAIEASDVGEKVVQVWFRPLVWSAAAALVVWLGMLGWNHGNRPEIIAELVSAEDAFWESSLPTEPGSKLTKGYFKLKEGIATIRFRSGAEMMVEAPA
ncbi:MAG: iron dicitrate transport regulator FecR, partial [Verrucomicrobiota bacterium]